MDTNTGSSNQVDTNRNGRDIGQMEKQIGSGWQTRSRAQGRDRTNGHQAGCRYPLLENTDSGVLGAATSCNQQRTMVSVTEIVADGAQQSAAKKWPRSGQNRLRL